MDFGHDRLWINHACVVFKAEIVEMPVLAKLVLIKLHQLGQVTFKNVAVDLVDVRRVLYRCVFVNDRFWKAALFKVKCSDLGGFTVSGNGQDITTYTLT